MSEQDFQDGQDATRREYMQEGFTQTAVIQVETNSAVVGVPKVPVA
jgi:hypothetical protein